MATSEIENTIYLLSQGLDSGGEGRFTLNKLPRSPALLQAAEQYPYRWVYFAVQAAVCAEASSVRLGSNAYQRERRVRGGGRAAGVFVGRLADGGGERLWACGAFVGSGCAVGIRSQSAFSRGAVRGKSLGLSAFVCRREQP